MKKKLKIILKQKEKKDDSIQYYQKTEDWLHGIK